MMSPTEGEPFITLYNFLDTDTFHTLQIKERALGALEYRSTTPLRSGAATSHIDAHDTPLEALFEAAESCDVPGRIERRTGLRLQLAPLTDHNRLSLLSYSRSGDHIWWHLDGNAYYGERWVGILVIINRGTAGLSDAELQFCRQDGAVLSADTPENSLTLFRGHKIRHQVTPLGQNQRRVVLSMVLCDEGVPKMGVFARVYQALVNLLFYGHA